MKRLKKGWLSGAIILTLMLSMFLTTGYAAVPEEGDWILPYHGDDACIITYSDSGTHFSFKKPDSGARAGNPNKFDLKDLSLKFADIEAGDDGQMAIGLVNGAYEWHDSQSVVFIISPDDKSVIIRRTTTDAEYLTLLEVPGDTIEVYFEQKGDEVWFISINGEEFNVDDYIVEALNDTSSTYISLGSWSDQEPISYRLVDVSNLTSSTPIPPYDIEIGDPNVTIEDFEDTWGVGVSLSQVDKGVMIGLNSYGKRATYIHSRDVDGLVIKLTDIELTGITENHVAFTLSSVKGDFTGGGNGVFFRLTQDADGVVQLYVKSASDLDDAGDDIYLPVTVLESFDGIPNDLEIEFVKNGEYYDITFNGETISILSGSIESEILEDGKAYIMFGGWGDLSLNYTVNYITGEVALPITDETPTIVDESTQDPDEYPPITGDVHPMMFLIILGVSLSMIFIIFRKNSYRNR